MTFTINSFYAHMKAMGGIAKPSRFEVLLPIPPYINNFISSTLYSQLANLPNTLFTSVIPSLTGGDKDTAKGATYSRYLALQCDSAELPGKTLQTADVKTYGPTIKLPYMAQYQDITLSFISTGDFWERKLFDKWLNSIIPNDTHNLRYQNEQSTRYTTPITIMQYDELITQIYAVELVDAFPIGISSQPLSWSEDGTHKLSVQFAYSKYIPIYDSEARLDKAAEEGISALFESVIQRNVGRGVSDVIGSVTSRIPGLGGSF
jgi:hypothetical protein